MMGLSPTLFLATAIFVLQSYHPSLSLADAVATSDKSHFNLRHHHQEVVDVDVGVDNDDDEPCDESFPLAPSQENYHHHHQQHQNNHHKRRRMVVLPSDPTRRTSAPLCTDPNDPHNILRINIHSRHLTTCNAGMCFVPAYQGCFHTTSYECNNANIIPLPAPLPTPAPAFPIVETVHPVKLILMGVPSGYTRLSAEVRSLILRYVSEMLGESLREVGLQFIKVDYAGRFKNGNYHNNDNDNGNNNNNDDSSSNNGGNGIKGPRPDSGKTEGKVRHLRASRHTNMQQQKQRRLDSIAVPLAITVKGPADISNFALAYIMETLRERFGDLILYLQENGEILNADGTVSVNGNGGNGDGGAQSGGKYVFEDLELSAEEYDFADVLTGSTDPPTDMPTRRPTGRPTTQSPVEGPVDNQEDEKEEMVIKVVDDTSNSSANSNINSDNQIVIKEETSAIPWWVWLIIILILVLLCICCVCGCLRRQRNNNRTKESKNNDNQQSVNIWMTNARATSFRNKSRGTNGDPRNKSREMNNINNKRSQQRGAPPKRVPNERRDGYDYSHNNEARRTSRPRIPRQISQTELEEETRAWEYGDREEYNNNNNNNEGRRRSRGPPARPRIPRQVSQTELDEEARAKEYEGEDVLADMVFGENNAAIVPVDTAVSLDPPEENAMVSYSSHHRHRHLDGSNRSESSSEEPQGVKVSKKASRYASQVYCGKPASRSRKNNSRDEMSHRSEEPEGAKIPKKGSMFAADAMVLYNNSSSPDPVESDYERQQQQQRKEPRGRRTPKKDSMFTCPMEDLPEEYRSKALRSGAAESRAVGNSSRRDPDDGRRRKRKSKKSKRSATDKLRSSLTRSLTRSRHRSTEDDSPQDIVIDHDDSVSDSPSMMTMPIELRKDDEPEEDLEGSSEQQSDIDESERSRYERADGRKKSKKKKKKKKERSSRAPEHSNAGGSGSRRTGGDTNGSMSSEDESVIDSPSMMNTFQRIEER